MPILFRYQIYQIIRSSIWFTDSSYALSIPSKESRLKHLASYQDYKKQGYRIISFDDYAYITKLVPHYLNYNEADLAARHIQNKIISKFSITEFRLKLNDSQEFINEWCEKHQILKEVRELEREIDKKIWNNLFDTSDDSESISIFWSTVEQYLKSINNEKLLFQMWQDLVGDMTLIQEITFEKPTYLKVDPYYSQLKYHNDNFVYIDGEEELSPEEREINLLLSALNNPQLNIRALAYQLLKGIDSEKAQQSVHLGFEIKPGDKVYTVYRSGITFTDEVYLLFDEEYLDYCEGLRDTVFTPNKQVQNEGQPDEYELAVEELMKCKPVYCCFSKELARQKAEELHREKLQKVGIGIGGFEWRRKNSDFVAKKWCEENSVPYPNLKKQNINYDCDTDNFELIWKIKEFIREIENEALEDNFRRSRYIYHPKHIDTWCKDNQLDYDPTLDNWESYQKVIEYLYLPENIELLSKFWKDGVGHFAFVKEEIIQDKVYLQIENNYIDLANPENSQLISLLKPENYSEVASKFLINVIENDRHSQEKRTRARENLQKISWEDIPF